MKNFKLSIIGTSFFLSFCAYSQMGSLAGKVTDTKTKEALIGVIVGVQNTSKVGLTSIDGSFVIDNIPEGLYTLKVSYIGYQVQLLKDITINTGEISNIKISLSEQSQDLNEVIVEGVKVEYTNTAATLINETRSLSMVASGISAQEIGKLPDRDVAEVAKRITGISVMNNRAIIRGMPDRYTTVMLNNTMAPVGEYDVRAFSLDIIPASAVDRILVYKTAAPELPGEFAGAVVKIFTHNLPQKNFLNIGYNLGYRSNTTFQNVNTPLESKDGWLGYNEQLYPNVTHSNSISEFQTAQKEYAKNHFLTKDEGKLWTPEGGKAPLDQRFSISAGRLFYLNKRNSMILGSTSALTYANTRSNLQEQTRNYNSPNGVATRDQRLVRNSFNTYNSHSVRIGALQNIGLKLGNKHSIDLKTLYNRLSNSDYFFINTSFDTYSDPSVRTYLDYLSREIFTGQLNGTHTLLPHVKLNWDIGYAQTKRNQPYRRQLTNQTNYTNRADPSSIYQYKNIGGFLPWNDGTVSIGLIEQVKTAGLGVEYDVPLFPLFKPKIRAGVFLEERSRNYSTIMTGIGIEQSGKIPNSAVQLSPSHFDSVLLQQNPAYPEDRLFTRQVGSPGSAATPANLSYGASNSLFAYYLGINIPILNKIHIYPGLRVETNKRQVWNYNKERRPSGPEPVIKDDKGFLLDTSVTTLLPSVNVTYHLLPKLQLRGAYSQTINRPEFREQTPVYFFDYLNFRYVSGDPTIKTSLIHNIDFRVEYYPSAGEIVSLAFFNKKVIDPIELGFVQYGEGGNDFKYFNSVSAQCYGFEVELRKSLKFINLDVFGKSISLKNLIITSNAAFTTSKIQNALNPDNKLFIDEANRPLTGQSPYIINGGIGYENPAKKITMNLVYNFIGPRLFAVGNGVDPSIYEMPRQSMDITMSKGIGKYIEMRGTIQNILNPRYQYMQDSNFDKKFNRDQSGSPSSWDQELSVGRIGVYYTLGINLVF